LKNERKGKYAGDRKVAIAEEVEHLTKTVNEEERLIDKLETIMNEMQSICGVSNLDLDNAYHLLGKLKVIFCIKCSPFSKDLYVLFYILLFLL